MTTAINYISYPTINNDSSHVEEEQSTLVPLHLERPPHTAGSGEEPSRNALKAPDVPCSPHGSAVVQMHVLNQAVCFHDGHSLLGLLFVQPQVVHCMRETACTAAEPSLRTVGLACARLFPDGSQLRLADEMLLVVCKVWPR
jgi:hypothetical protein